MDDYDEYNSDDDVVEKQHARLVDGIFQLDKKQYVKKPSRTEPAIQVSEFNLVKQAKGRKAPIRIKDLTKSLQKKEKHVAISKKVKTAQTKSNTLLTPASKPQAERIRRSLGFDKVTTELGKWDAIVEKNRVASQLMFPLKQGEIVIADNKKVQNEYQPRYKSELDIELEKLEPVKPAKVAKIQFPLSMEELIQRRKEMATLRAHQSYLEAKAYKKKKIKSKTFHKIQRKERLREKIKEFEILQKTDPEAALQKLEELEKVRAEERMSLRHRSTGHWARNKQVQAKYNKESRKALAQQLSLSRELTQKMKVNNSSDSETEEPPPDKPLDTSNPWIANRSSEMKSFITGYRKFWNEQNKQNLEDNSTSDKKDMDVVEDYVEIDKNDAEIDKNRPKTNKYDTEVENDIAKIDNGTKNIKSNPIKTIEIENRETKLLKKRKPTKVIKNKIMKLKKPNSLSYCNSNWNIQDLFDELEIKTRKKFQDKINKVKTVTKKRKSTEDLTVSNKIQKKSDLSMPREKLRPEIDEELGLDDKEVNSNKITEIINLSKADTSKNVDMDPNKYASVKTVDLDTKLPTISLQDDNVEDEENDQRAFISEAFEDDDIVADFAKEKQDTIDKDKPKNIDLGLPGWGSWGGKNIKISKRKRKRFIIKLPKELPRRDKNKGDVIINEKKNDKLQGHQVSELPFPFKTVKDFEASVRAPIGDTFLPQTAFRRLIKPAVVVKKGNVIEPMSDDILLKQKFTKNGFLVNR